MKKFLVPIVSVVALVVGLIALSKASNLPVPAPTPALGGVIDVKNGGATFPAGADFGGPTPVTTNWAGDKIYAKTNQASWKNTTGQTQYVDYAEVSTDGFASSTFKIFVVATSTAARTLYDFVAPTGTSSSLINGFQFATSTFATTTTNFDKAFTGKTVQVRDGQFVDIYLTAVDDRACPTTKLCETATSTNRGFNAYWRLRYHN